MKVKGKITTLHHDFSCGMVTVQKLGKVFFSADTQLLNFKFEDLKIDEPVEIEYVETSRGLFAKSINKQASKSKSLPTDAIA